MGWLFKQHPPSGCSILLHEQLATVPSWKFKFKWISALASIPWFAVVCDWGFRETHLHSIPVYDTFCVVLMSLQSPTSRIGSFPPSTAGAVLGRHSDTSPTSVLLGNTRVVPCIFMPTIALGNVGKCAWNEMSNRKKARFPACLLIPVSLGVLVFGSPNLAVYSD